MPGAKGKSGGKREGAGRDTFAPTQKDRDTVQSLAAFGLRHEDIVLFVTGDTGKPISGATLAKHFPTELAQGKLRANVTIAQALYKKAKAGDTACMLFWLKTRMGWHEKQLVEHTGKDGAPIQTQRVIDPNDLTDEQLAAIAAGGG